MHNENDLKAVSPGIAHFGVGNFHRSHQAMYIDKLIAGGDHNDWGIIGIGVMLGDIRMRDALSSQNYAYTLVEKSGDGTAIANTIRSLCGFLYGPEDPSAVIAQLADPAIRIVSLTITEGGYNIDQSTGEFILDNPAIQRDLATPNQPSTVFGYIVESLRIRRAHGVPPFTIMSCDNLPGNGDVARHSVVTFARALDADLADWIEQNVAFPNGMVDRITPVTTDADREFVQREFGIQDAWPVITEPYTQWVLEDHFCNGRPAYERVGVQMVDDVVPYELLKLRMLNASHQAMAYIGMLRGHTFVHEAVADSAIRQLLLNWFAEARTTLPAVPGIDVDEYIASLFTRYSNPYIADTLARLAVDASDRIPKFVLPVIRDNLAAGRSIETGAEIIVSWMKYLQTGAQVVDPLAGLLIPLANEADQFLAVEAVFGELGQSAILRKAVADSFNRNS